MIKPILNTVFNIMCTSDDPLQTKSNIETMLEDNNDEEEVDDTENLFTNSTQVTLCAIFFLQNAKIILFSRYLIIVLSIFQQKNS
jgi:hypothetical protein